MQTTTIHEAAEKTFVLVFNTDDEFMQGLRSFAREQQITAAHFTAIGAFRAVTLGFFEMERKDYLEINIDEQVEVLSLVGNIALSKGEPKIHAHVVVGKRDGTAHGGHVLKAHVRPTLEVVLVESPQHLRRQTDAATGLALLQV